MTDCRAPIILAVFAVAALAGCARHPVVAPLAALIPEPIPDRPVLQAGYAAVVPPPLGADGRYRTINAGIAPQQAAWHLRAALNVAAIGCRGAADATIAPSYNAMLADKKAVLAAANHSVETSFRVRSAVTWQNDHDAYMTRLYNFFAMPAAKPAFCAAADTIAPLAAATPSADFVAAAPPALAQLEAPFDAVFSAVDRYHIELADWDARYGPNAPATRMAAALPPPMRSAGSTPTLAYADLAPMMTWEPHRVQALASR